MDQTDLSVGGELKPSGSSTRPTLGPAQYIFAAVFLLRLVALLRLTGSQFLLPTQGDMHFYNDWALRIARGEWTDYQAFYGLPLYAYLLAAVYKVFGFSPFMPALLQAAAEGGTAMMLYKIGARVFGGTSARLLQSGAPLRLERGAVIGLLAAAAWAFYLPAQSYSVILMPTAWLVFIFWWLVWRVIATPSLPSPARLLGLGLLIGFTAMGIATILFLLPLLFAAILFRWPAGAPDVHPRWRAAVRGIALLMVGVVIGASPAWSHNYFVARDRVFLSAHSGVNLWIGNNPIANGYPRFPLGLRAGQEAMLRDSITGAEAAAGRKLKRSEVSTYWSNQAKAYIAANPVAWLKLLGVKIANFWNSFQYDDLSIITSLREQGVTFPGFRFGVVAALAIPGMILGAASIPASRWIIGAILLHMASLLSVFVTERYRLAAVPGLLLFAAWTVRELWYACAHLRLARVGCIFALLVASCWFVSIRRSEAELWSLDAYNSGLHALEANQLAAAERKLSLAYAYVPGNAELNFALGNLQLARGDREAAKGGYERTLELNPRHEGTFNNLGVLALEEGHADAALRSFEQALLISPDDAKTHYLLARAALGTGDMQRAAAAVETAARLKPAQPEFIQLRDEIAAKR